jgi:hypothetical protein
MYKGWTQYCTWISRPRQIREWIDNGAVVPGTKLEEWFNRLVEIVSHVHQHEVLRRFWRHGVAVENTTMIGTHTHPYQTPTQTDGSWESLWEAYPKNYHLHTNLDPTFDPPVEVLRAEDNPAWPVYTLAYVIGETPNREWLVYAHSTGILGAVYAAQVVTQQGSGATPLADVEVDIPGYETITLPEVPIEGAFYHVVE